MSLPNELEHIAFASLIEHIRLAAEDAKRLGVLREQPGWDLIAVQLDKFREIVYALAMKGVN